MNLPAPLEALLRRSDDLHAAIIDLVGDAGVYPSKRCEASFGMCSMALEHALSIRTLIAAELPTSAAGLMRLQFECVTRAVWLLYVADDEQVELLHQPLSAESAHAAGRLPAISKMLEKIEERAPDEPVRLLREFREQSLKALNSYVHAGLHPLRRHLEGYPLPLIIQLVQNSNGLAGMVGSMLAILSGVPGLTKPMSWLQHDFLDCFPAPRRD